MRDLLLLAIVTVLCAVGLVRPRIGLYGYIWFALLRPDVLAWSYGEKPYSLAIAVCTLLGSAASIPHRVALLFANPFALLLMLFVGLATLTSFTAVSPSLAMEPLQLFLRMVVFAFLIPLLIQSYKQLRTLLIICAISLGFLCAKVGIFGLIHRGVRFSAGYGGMLSDNNTMALAFVMVVPIIFYTRSYFKQKWIQMGFLVVFTAGIAAIVMTYSRGAALALAGVMLAVVLRSKQKIIAGIMLFVSIGLSVYLVRDSYLDRLSTILDPTEENSANSRLVLAGIAMRMFADHPLLGVGFGRTNQQMLLINYIPQGVGLYPDRVIHNTFLQLLVDCGIIGFSVYMILMISAFVWLFRFRRRYRETHPDIARLAVALEAALLAFAIGALFLSRVEFDFYYILIMCVAALYQIQKEGQPLEDLTVSMGLSVMQPAAEIAGTPEMSPAGYSPEFASVKAPDPAIPIGGAQQEETADAVSEPVNSGGLTARERRMMLRRQPRQT